MGGCPQIVDCLTPISIVGIMNRKEYLCELKNIEDGGYQTTGEGALS